MVDAQTLTTMFGGIGIGVAAIYYIFNMRAQTRTREAQLFMQSFNIWLTQGFIEKSLARAR